MKKIVFVICLTMLFKPLVPLLEYVYNYDYIAKELCENRANVVKGCNGKCYLMKQLAKEAEAEKPLSSDKKHSVAETADLFVSELNGFNFSIVAKSMSANNYSAYNNLYAHLQTNSFFHPPTVIA